jgi:hypothetical protein
MFFSIWLVDGAGWHWWKFKGAKQKARLTAQINVYIAELLVGFLDNLLVRLSIAGSKTTFFSELWFPLQTCDRR